MGFFSTNERYLKKIALVCIIGFDQLKAKKKAFHNTKQLENMYPKQLKSWLVFRSVGSVRDGPILSIPIAVAEIYHKHTGLEELFFVL